jgi:hypothetical protein
MFTTSRLMKSIRIAMPCAWLLLALVYPFIGSGVLAWTGSSIFYCHELRSSGNDDDLVIAISAFVSIIVTVLLIFPMSFSVKFNSLLLVSTGAVAFWIASVLLIECGSVIDMLLYGHDIILICIIALQLLSISIEAFHERERNNGVS